MPGDALHWLPGRGKLRIAALGLARPLVTTAAGPRQRVRRELLLVEMLHEREGGSLGVGVLPASLTRDTIK